MNRKRCNIFSTLSILFFITASLLYAEEFLNYPSGSYNDDIYISIIDIGNSDDIFYSFIKDDPSPSIPYSGGMLLSAIPGEQRDYNISFKIDNENYAFEYDIDKKAPKIPKPVFVSNENGSGYIFDSDESVDVYILYGYDEYNRGELFLWEGELISPPKSGFVFYFAEDAAGNRSGTSVIRPEQQSESFYRSTLTVKSPVEGVFLNTQLLYIDQKGFDWIKYTLNGYDPVKTGAEYNEPVEIRRYGNVNLKIAAKPVNSNELIYKDINYQVNTRAPLKLPPSGIYADGIKIKSYMTGYRYCLEDRSPRAEDSLFDNDLNINPIYGGVKYSIVRINDSENPLDGDYRYFYIIDDRFPASPIIKCDNRLPEENLIDVSITGPVYSDIYYSIDGTTPGRTSSHYRETFTLDIPENKNAGSVIIKARALSLNGKPSSVVSKIFTYDTKNPDSPSVSIDQNNDTGLFELNYQMLQDENLYFAMTDNEDNKSIPYTEFSKVDKDNFFLDVPEGMFKKFIFLFASADTAGNWSEITEPIIIEIDKTYPEIPSVEFNDNIITIYSDYNVSYSYDILKNGNIIYSASGLYSDPIALDDEYFDGTLRLNLEITDASGKKYRTNLKYYFPAEEREKEALLFSRKSEDIYSGEEVSFYAYPDGLNDELFYYLTEYKEDGTKNTSGPFETDGYISISGVENRKLDYFLEVFSVNEDGSSKSRVNSYEFTIDNEKPAIPTIEGITKGSTIGDRVRLTTGNDEDSIVFLNYSNDENDLGYLFTNNSIIFNKPLVFDVEEGEEKTFFLKIGAGDSAGNSVENPEIFSFTIDKKAPEITDFSIDCDSLSNSGPITISFPGEENTKYFYEKGVKGSRINEPDSNSRYFTESLVLDSSSKSDEAFIVKVIPIDEVGNFGRYPFSFMYRIDKETPISEEPDIILNRKYKKLFASWPLAEDKIFYRIVTDEQNENEMDWIEYVNPFSVKYNSENRAVRFDYYFQDVNGNKSIINSKKIMLPATLNNELVSGIKNNSFNNSDLELVKLETAGVIRYEITTDQVLPPEVSVFSPVLPDVLPFKIEDGESINFTVSIKEFQDENDIIGGAEQVLQFSIDKQGPEPPAIGGIKDGEYYLSNCSAYFKPSIDKVFYSVSNTIMPEEKFTEYIDGFEIESPEGTYYSFVVKAYTEDFSGNRSSVKSWEITIDKEIIYVSDEGRDYFEGTRSKPFQSLNKALEQVKLSKRKTIFIEEGEYHLRTPAVIDETVTIYGGFRKGNWQEKTGITTIKLDNNFPDDNPAFYIYGGNLTVENIDLDITPTIESTVFYVNKGNLNIQNSRVNIESNNRTSFLTQHYGKLIINNSELSGTIKESPLLNNDYGTVNINNCNFDFHSKAYKSTLINASNCVDYTVNSSSISFEGGNDTTALKFVNSSVKLKSNTVKTSGAGVTSTLIESVDSKINIDYSRFISGDTNRISRAVVAEDSMLALKGSTFNLDSKTGILGFNLIGGSSSFINNHIATKECNDFVYLFMFNDGQHDIETNIIKTATADDIIHLRTKGSNVDFINNTISIEAGRNRTIAFKPEEESTNRIINNIVNNSAGLYGSTVLFLDNDKNMISLKNNNLFGWAEYTGGIISTNELVSLDLIDGIYSGGRFSGNISESPAETFSVPDSVQLSPDSRCIDSGYDVENILKMSLDIDGHIRPNSSIRRNSAFDIGADEYYQ